MAEKQAPSKRYSWLDIVSQLFGRNHCPVAEDPITNAPVMPVATIQVVGEVVAPAEQVTTKIKLSPIEVLYAEAETAGLRVLDLRGLSRKTLYPAKHRCVLRGNEVLSLPSHKLMPGDQDFGAWGYFRRKDGKFTETPPVRGKAHGVRPWKKMTSTVIHTADSILTGSRFIGVPAQHGIASDATIVLCHPINAYMYHANTANRFSDGIEVSGKSTITQPQTTAARILLRYIDAEKERQGVARRFVTPHAFSSKNKAEDPGPVIWEAVGQWAQDELGMTLGPVVGTGTHPEWVQGTPSNRKTNA